MVLKNSLWLYFFQAANYLSPLIIYPLLLASTDAYSFGVVAIIISISQFFNVLVDFGSTTTGVERYVKSQTDQTHILLKKVQSAKFLIISVFCIFSLCIFFLLQVSIYLYLTILIGIISQSLFPLWYFHSKKELSFISTTNAFSKFLLIILVLLKVDSYEDFLICWSITNLLSLIIYCLIIKLRWNENIVYLNIGLAYKEIIYSWQFAFAKMLTAIYTSLGAAIIGTFSISGAGAFLIADQIYRAGQSLYNPVFQAAYPIYAQNKNLSEYLVMVKKMSIVVFAFALLLFFLSNQIISFLYGENIISIALLKIFSVILIINFAGVSCGYNIFAIIDKLEYTNRTVITGSLLYCLILSLLVTFNSLNEVNLVISILATELFVALYRFVLFTKERND